jgi:hypothetical protein
VNRGREAPLEQRALGRVLREVERARSSSSVIASNARRSSSDPQNSSMYLIRTSGLDTGPVARCFEDE